MDQQGPPPTTNSSITHRLLAVVVFEFALGTIVMVLRTYTKFRLTKDAEKWSYIWSMITWVAGVISSTAVILSVSYGLGKGTSILTPDAIVNAVKWSWIADGTARLGSACGRVIVVAFIYGVQGPTAPRWRKVFLWFIGVSNIVLSTIAIFLLFFRCSPPSYIWDRSIPGATCKLEAVTQYSAFFVLSYGAASDLILVCYPVSIILRLKMRLRTKLTLSLLLSMGLLACAFAIMTIYEFVKVTAAASKFHDNSVPNDPTNVLTPVTMWAVSEMWIIYIAASVAPLWPLVKKVTGQKKSRTSSSTSSQQQFVTARSIISRPYSETKNNSPLQITVVRDFDIESVQNSMNENEKRHSVTAPV